MPLPHERYCDEIVAQSEQLTALLDGADRDLPVPTCPAWTLADLLDHVTSNLRTLTGAVHAAEARTTRLRAGEVSVDSRAGGPTVSADPPALGRAATEAAAALRRAGPHLRVRVCGLDGTARTWARRTAHDLLIHRADVALTLGGSFDAAPDAGADALDELLELFAGPPVPRTARRPQLVLHATDTGTTWGISPDGASFTWRREPADGATAGAELAGPQTELLLVTYRRRRPERAADGATDGTAALLDPWLASLTFT